MKRFFFTALCILAIAQYTSAQNKPAYQLFKNNGKKAKYDKMIKDLAQGDMVFFGEYHTNPIAHWLQLEMCKSFYEVKGDALFLGAEMFENGNQLVIDEYLQGFYREDKLTPEITQLWGNFQTDYKPLLDFAKEKQLRFIATNIPRRYASMIYKMGIDALTKLSPDALEMIGPDLEKHFDPTAKAYAEMAEKMGGHVPKNMLNMQLSQASKDATMAHFILLNVEDGKLLLHFNGAYHSDDFESINYMLKRKNPSLKIVTISNVKQDDVSEIEEENLGKADFILAVPSSMTRTRTQ